MRRVLLLVLGLAAASAAGCGQSNPELIPQSNAEALKQTADEQLGLLDTGNYRRCPGSNERPAPDGSNPWNPGGDTCDPSIIPPGD